MSIFDEKTCAELAKTLTACVYVTLKLKTFMQVRPLLQKQVIIQM